MPKTTPSSVTLRVNGEVREVEATSGTTLLLALRNQLGLTAAKPGCGLEQCLACAVLVDGQAVPSCASPVEQFAGTEITTLEGLGTPEHPHPLQRAFIAEDAAQCGFCIPGMIVAAKALLDATPSPTEAEIRAALDGHLCRCGTHPRILAAVRRCRVQRTP